jgi:radical SAM superfamily enzyme YgiQ (UPF0313 family)
MRIDLIHPSLEKSGTYVGVEGPKVASLSLSTLAAATPNGMEVKILDERVEDLNFSFSADLVGITFMSRLATRAYWIAEQYRKKKIPVVMGGIHSSMRPQEALQHCDSVVIGEAEELWPTLLRDFQAGKLKRIYRNHLPPSLTDLCLPRRDLLKKKKYVTINTIEATRGCPHACGFCYSPNFHMRNFRCKPVKKMVAEIKSLKRKELIFIDDNIIGNPRYAKALFTAMIPLKKLWFSQCSINIAEDDELLNLAVKSGCRVLLIGFETLSDKNLAASSKKWSKAESYKRVIKKLHAKGVAILGSFITGFDDDDKNVFENILHFSIDNKLEFIQVNPLAFYPGSDLYEQEIQRGSKTGRLIEPNWWQKPFPYVYKVHFHPSMMSPEELENGCVWLMKQFYSMGSIIKRLRKASLPLLFNYWLVNLGLRNIGSTLPVMGYNPSRSNNRPPTPISDK